MTQTNNDNALEQLLANYLAEDGIVLPAAALGAVLEEMKALKMATTAISRSFENTEDRLDIE